MPWFNGATDQPYRAPGATVASQYGAATGGYGHYAATQGVDRVYRTTLPQDPEQASMTALEYIHQLVRDAREDPVVRAAAIRIMQQAGVPQRDKRGQILAIHDWVKTHVQYVNDPNGVETLIRARNLLAMIDRGEAWADCDDHVILEHGLLSSLGIDTRTVILKSDPRYRDQWSHIYLEAHDGQRWVPLDPIVKNQPAGWSPPRYFDKRVIPIGNGPPFPFADQPGQMTVEHMAGPGMAGPGMAGSSSWAGFGRYGTAGAYGQTAEFAPPGCPPDLKTDADQTVLTALEGKGLARAEASRQRFTFETQVYGGQAHADWRAAQAGRAGGWPLAYAEQLLRVAGQYHADLRPALEQRAAFLAQCAAGEQVARAAAEPERLQLGLLRRTRELRAMRAEAMSYVLPLLESVPPLVDTLDRSVARIEGRQAYLAAVNEGAQVATTVLSMLGPATGGITELVGVAVQLGNLAYQMRQIGRLMGGSAMATLNEAAGAVDRIQDDMDAALEVAGLADGELVNTLATLEQCFPGAAAAAQAGVPTRRLGPLALVLATLAVGGVALAAA